MKRRFRSLAAFVVLCASPLLLSGHALSADAGPLVISVPQGFDGADQER